MANPVAWGIRRAGSAGGAARPCATRALRRPRTAGILMAGLGLILAASSIAWIVIIRSLIAMGTILGWPPPFDVPFCVAVVVLLLIYAIVAGQISALRRAANCPMGVFIGAGSRLGMASRAPLSLSPSPGSLITTCPRCTTSEIKLARLGVRRPKASSGIDRRAVGAMTPATGLH